MKKLMAANWKMYKTGAEAVATLNELAGLLNGQAPEGREIVIFVPFTALEKASDAMKAIKGGMTGAENMYPAAEGAFTGEISARRCYSWHRSKPRRCCRRRELRMDGYVCRLC